MNDQFAELFDCPHCLECPHDHGIRMMTSEQMRRRIGDMAAHAERTKDPADIWTLAALVAGVADENRAAS
jgi:hypothetical protein